MTSVVDESMIAHQLSCYFCPCCGKIPDQKELKEGVCWAHSWRVEKAWQHEAAGLSVSLARK